MDDSERVNLESSKSVNDAVTIIQSQPSFLSKLVAVIPMALAVLKFLQITGDELKAWVMGYAVNHQQEVMYLIFIVVLFGVGALVYDRAMTRAHERTLKMAESHADDNQRSVKIEP